MQGKSSKIPTHTRRFAGRQSNHILHNKVHARFDNAIGAVHTQQQLVFIFIERVASVQPSARIASKVLKIGKPNRKKANNSVRRMKMRNKTKWDIIGIIDVSVSAVLR